MLWPEDMPAASTISLSANDDLVPCDLVRAQMEASPKGAKVLVHPTAGHGEDQLSAYLPCLPSTLHVDASKLQILPARTGCLLGISLHGDTMPVNIPHLASHAKCMWLLSQSCA